MADNDAEDVYAFVQDMADEYRADTLARLAAVATALEELNGVQVSDGNALSEIKHHAHSIKGSSSTFGFHGLSIIAHAMDSFVDHGPQEDLIAYLSDLKRLNELMVTVTESSDIVPEDTAATMLSRATLETGYDFGQKDISNNGLEGPLVLLVSEMKSDLMELPHVLSTAGLTVLHARDGVEAIEAAAWHETSAVIIPLHSGRLTAPEIAQVFSEVQATASIPIIVLIPELDSGTSHEQDEAMRLLVSALPSSTHQIPHDGALDESLVAKMTELGIISSDA